MALVVLAGGAILLVVGFVRAQNASPAFAAVDTTGSSGRPVSRAKKSTPSAGWAPGARWAPDPFERHQFRYWNGKKWTEKVSGGDGITSDPPTYSSGAPMASPGLEPLPVAEDPKPLLQPPSVAAEPMLRVAPPNALGQQNPDVRLLAFADGRDVQLSKPIVVGRAPEAPSSQPDATLHAVADLTVSKTHVLIGQSGDEVWVEDLDSRNGIVVVSGTGDRVNIGSGQRVLLESGDRVEVGDSTSFTVQSLKVQPDGRLG